MKIVHNKWEIGKMVITETVDRYFGKETKLAYQFHITEEIQNLISKRQIAKRNGNKEEYKKLRNMITI